MQTISITQLRILPVGVPADAMGGWRWLLTALLLLAGCARCFGDQAPANDDFADAQLITDPLPQQVSGTTIGATLESGGAGTALDGLTGSVWYAYSPLATETIQIETTSDGSWTPVQTVFVGSSPTSLEQLSDATGSSDQTDTAGCALTLLAGTTYYIRVGAPDEADVGAFSLQLQAPQPPSFFFPSFQFAYVGLPFTASISAQNYPTSWTAYSLPAGITIDAVTGVLSGTPLPATQPLLTSYLTASNLAGSATTSVQFVIAAPPVLIDQANDLACTVGVPLLRACSASPMRRVRPSAWSGLPPGLELLDPATFTISGTPQTGSEGLTVVQVGGSGTDGSASAAAASRSS